MQVIDASTVRRWARTACEALGAAAAEIDALNVFPVPDGDTGTNLHLTLRSAVEALDSGDQQAELTPTLDRLARGALLGARGNSGVIVSQLLRGIADRLGKAGPADGPALAAALSHAAELAYGAVAEPVEGTILTVAREAAAAASAAVAVAVAHAGGRARLQDVAQAATQGAASALEATTAQLAALARAGVVDAGGRGLCVLLDALLAAVSGGELSVAPPVQPVADTLPSPLEVARDGGPATYGYEVQFLLEDADDESVEVLRGELAVLGDSLVVVGSQATSEAPAIWSVHVHVDDAGAAIEAGVRAGRPHSITVLRFADQPAVVDDTCHAQPSLPGQQPSRSWSGRGLVAVAPGAGMAGLFAGEGVEVVEGGPSRHPSISDVLAAIRRTGAAEVVVLPNHISLTAVADAAAMQARAGGQDVAVVPTKSPVQGLAAIAVADSTRRFGDVVIALAEAAAATRWAEITVAGREAMTSAGRCAAGDVLGLAEGDVVLIGVDQVRVTCDLLDRLLSAGGELVTLILGTDSVDGFIDDVRAHLRRAHPGVDVMDYRGDQPSLPVLIGVE